MMQRIAHDKAEVLPVKTGDFVIFLVAEDWAQLAGEQKGMDDNATSLPFTMGKVVKEEGEIQEEEDVEVEVWYTPKGDPNGSWYIWRRADAKGKSQGVWRIPISRQSIVFVLDDKADFMASKSSRDSKTITAKARKAMAERRRFPWFFLEGHGLMPGHEVEEELKRQLSMIHNKKSKTGKRSVAKVEGKLAQYNRVFKTRERCNAEEEKELQQEEEDLYEQDQED
jgi:hypothetical protein